MAPHPLLEKPYKSKALPLQGANLVLYVQNVGQGDVELNKDQSVYVNSNLVAITSTRYGKNPNTRRSNCRTYDYAPYTPGTKVSIKVTTTDGTFMTTTGTGTSTTNPSPTTPPVNYDVVVTQAANGVIAPGGTTSYAAGSTPSFTITPDVGYHIASVTTNAGAQALTSPYVFPALSADGTLTATFAANTVNYDVVVTQTANGVIAPGGTTSYAAGSTPSFTITPDVGYHIASVTTNAGAQALTSPYVFPALSADGTLTATFAANIVQYSVTFTLGANGATISPAAGAHTYDSGQVVPISATANSGYHFTSWTSTTTSITFANANSASTTATIGAAGTITANFAINTPVTITLRPNAVGTTTQLSAQGSGSANWDRVDEVTADGTTTYVRGNSDDNWQVDTYNIPNQVLTGTITNVRIYVRAMESVDRPSDTYGRTAIRIGTGSIEYGAQLGLTTSWADYNTNYATKTGNLGSGSWTWTNIDDLQIGVSLQSHDSGWSGGWRYAQCTQVWVEITYTPE